MLYLRPMSVAEGRSGGQGVTAGTTITVAAGCAASPLWRGWRNPGRVPLKQGHHLARHPPMGNANVEDERRLFDVAVTRATSNLVVSFVRHAVRSRVEPSQFIAEMGLKDAEEKRAKVLS